MALYYAKVIEKDIDCLILQDEINLVFGWWSINRLNLNIIKCLVLRFSRNENIIQFSYLNNNHRINHVNEIKDQSFTFISHINQVISSALQMFDVVSSSTLRHSLQ